MRNSWTRQRQICRLAICSASGDAEQPVPLHSVPCSYDQIHGQEPFTNFWKFLCKIHSFFKFFNIDISQKNLNFWPLTQYASFLPLGEQNSPEAVKWISRYLRANVYCVSFMPFFSTKWRTHKPLQFWISLSKVLLWTGGICVATHNPEIYVEVTLFCRVQLPVRLLQPGSGCIEVCVPSPKALSKLQKVWV